LIPAGVTVTDGPRGEEGENGCRKTCVFWGASISKAEGPHEKSECEREKRTQLTRGKRREIETGRVLTADNNLKLSPLHGEKKEG